PGLVSPPNSPDAFSIVRNGLARQTILRSTREDTDPFLRQVQEFVHDRGHPSTTFALHADSPPQKTIRQARECRSYDVSHDGVPPDQLSRNRCPCDERSERN